jgi:hypothetical protein
VAEGREGPEGTQGMPASTCLTSFFGGGHSRYACKHMPYWGGAVSQVNKALCTRVEKELKVRLHAKMNLHTLYGRGV